jgi:hypothetical protein
MLHDLNDLNDLKLLRLPQARKLNLNLNFNLNLADLNDLKPDLKKNAVYAA